MKSETRRLLLAHRDDPQMWVSSVGVCDQPIGGLILSLMETAAASSDWEACDALFDVACALKDPQVRVDTLNGLMVLPGHRLHQMVTMQVQRLRSPSSVPFIRLMLERGFSELDYTCSESGVLAKWFSHALAAIGNTEARSLIAEFSESSDPAVAAEMRYRLAKLDV